MSELLRCLTQPTPCHASQCQQLHRPACLCMYNRITDTSSCHLVKICTSRGSPCSHMNLAAMQCRWLRPCAKNHLLLPQFLLDRHTPNSRCRALSRRDQAGQTIVKRSDLSDNPRWGLDTRRSGWHTRKWALSLGRQGKLPRRRCKSTQWSP